MDENQASQSEDSNSGAFQAPASKEALLEIARKRFKECVEAESQTRIEEQDDQKFLTGDQWPDDVRRLRESDSRPCLVINRIPQYVHQITNDQRQNRPSNKINPVDDKADIETAKIFQGIIRHTEYNSHADVAHDTAFEWAAESGVGYWRIVREYADAMSFQQEIKDKAIHDRFSVYLDPFSQEPDGSDANYGFIVETMSKDEFVEQYPDAKLSSMTEWEDLGSITDQWIEENAARVCEYYYKVYETQEIVLLSDGRVALKKDLPEVLPDGLKVTRSKKAQIPKIKWAKINGIEVLEETEEPGEYIPIIKVVGKQKIIDGKKVYSGLVRNSKDPQRQYNYFVSAQTEAIALAPRAPFIGAEGQFEDHEDQWQTANSKNHAYLEYKPTTIAGQPVAPPQRQSFEPAVHAITQARVGSAEDLKATTGIYDDTLGNQSQDAQSGVAIQRRNHQSQTSNFHFSDNFARSLRHAGRIKLQWIPKVYDTAQVMRIFGDDGEVDFVKVNEIFNEGGEEKSHFLDHGRYDVTVDTGPSYQTKRQEAVASMLDLARSMPQSMQMAMDLLVRNMDWPGSQEIADRLKKLLPPQLADDGKDKQPIPPQVKAQMDQMSQMIQNLSQIVHQQKDVIDTKKVELESRERIEAFKAQNDLVLELIKHNAKDGQVAFSEEMKLLHKRLDMLGINQPIDNGAGGDAMVPQNTPQPVGGSPAGQGAMQ